MEGIVEKVPEDEATAYYHSRPRGSQVGAWVSNQSQPVAGRAELEERWVLCGGGRGGGPRGGGGGGGGGGRPPRAGGLVPPTHSV